MEKQMKSNKLLKLALAIIVSSTTLLTGCAEGPLWQAGKYSPWVRNQWAEEEKIADTIFMRKNRMNQMVATAKNGSVEQMDSAALALKETVLKDPILLMRLHATQLLGDLNCPNSIDALTEASHDPNSDVRIAAVQSWAKLPGEFAIPHLMDVIGSDTNVDVRLAATRALGNFQGKDAVAALAMALEDSDPALQLRATESLRRATGESIGRDVSAWKKYVRHSTSLPSNVKPDSTSQTDESIAEDDDNRFFR